MEELKGLSQLQVERLNALGADTVLAALDDSEASRVGREQMVELVHEGLGYQIAEDELRELFNKMDANQNGFLEKQELLGLLRVIHEEFGPHSTANDEESGVKNPFNFPKNDRPAPAFRLAGDVTDYKFFDIYEKKLNTISEAQRAYREVVMTVPSGEGKFGFAAIARVSGNLFIKSVQPFSVASANGMQPLDVVVSVDGVNIGRGSDELVSPEEILRRMSKFAPGQQVTMKMYYLKNVELGDSRAEFNAVVEAYRHANKGAREEHQTIELSIVASKELGMRTMVFGHKGDHEVVHTTVVKQVTFGGAAFNAGFRMFDIIIDIGGASTRHTAANDLQTLIKRADEIEGEIRITVIRLSDAQLNALAARQTGTSCGYGSFASLASIALLTRLMLFVPFLYAMVLMLTYGSQNVWTLLTSAVTLIALIEADKLFFHNFVSQANKKKFNDDLTTTEESHLHKHLEQVEVATSVAKFLSGSVRSDMIQSLQNHSLAQIRDQVSHNKRDGASGRDKRVGLILPPTFGVEWLSKLSAPKMIVSERSRPPFKEDLGIIPQSLYTYTAWKVTQGDLPKPLMFKFILLVVLQIGSVFEIISQFKTPKDICIYDSEYKTLTLILAVVLVLAFALHDVYNMLVSVNILIWEDHYRDFCGYKSAWYRTMFSVEFFSPLPVITNMLVGLTMIASSVPVAPVLLAGITAWVASAVDKCKQ